MDNPLPNNLPIGYVVGGSLKDALRVRLTVPPQEVQEGSFVVVENGDWLFYGLVTNMELGATDPRFADEQSEARLPAGLAGLLHGQTLYTTLEVMPSLMLDMEPLDTGDPNDNFDARKRAWDQRHPNGANSLVPVKTVPSHHAPVRQAQAGDVAQIFGDPQEDSKYFWVGSTREQGHPVCIDLKQFVQRSAGIFGATGTGKSFLTRIILSGLIHTGFASTLIFDMHNEYGFDDTESDQNQSIPGLRNKFGSRVRVVGLGRGSSIRGHQPDFDLEIAESDIMPEDVEMLTAELNLKETTPTTLEALAQTYGREGWFHAFKHMKQGTKLEGDDGKPFPDPNSLEGWALEHGVNEAAAKGLQSKLNRVFHLPYICEQPASNTLEEIVKALEAGQHVILCFGKHESDLDYLLVTNLLTRKIRARWERKVNDFRSGQTKTEPKPLVIVVEEAHKLLNREMAAQTTFSTIAREMRKYYVTLLIIDQRPSQIYDEVMSQLGTRISGKLGDDADISAVLSGLPGRDLLRGMLSHLQPKEEVLLLGWGVPMPIPVRTRRYDAVFWQELLGVGSKRAESVILKELGF